MFQHQFEADAAALVERMEGSNPFKGGAYGVLAAIRSNTRILHIRARTNENLVLMAQGLQFLSGRSEREGKRWVLRIINAEKAEAFLAYEESQMVTLDSYDYIMHYTWKNFQTRRSSDETQPHLMRDLDPRSEVFVVVTVIKDAHLANLLKIIEDSDHWKNCCCILCDCPLGGATKYNKWLLKMLLSWDGQLKVGRLLLTATDRDLSEILGPKAAANNHVEVLHGE